MWEMQFCVQDERALTGRITAWGTITTGSRSSLVFLGRNITAEYCIYNVLETVPVLYPWPARLSEDQTAPHSF